MALAPLSQTVILTEDGIPVLAKTQVPIPPFVLSLQTLFEGGRRFNSVRPSDVPGLVEKFRELEAICKSKGR
ncbi:hypothetical protein [Sphingomonas sp. CFBP 8760]|uniref:hypothetical protein n=1 Tax=Sphingomonas sp. CFBP 8760 TaxID=2775282 RepID=UPI001781763B|nr:hypothetical protein [Sphingomonas sp. CFBP 8760]MBD8547901.1 hypothetical protein [Sphingomonas sp. CFBP 8760]